MSANLLKTLEKEVLSLKTCVPVGRICAIEDACLWANGLDLDCAVGDQVELVPRFGPISTGEVVRIRDGRVAILPDGGLGGFALRDAVRRLPNAAAAPSEAWIGRVVDPGGLPLDGLPLMRGAVPHTHVRPPAAAARRRLGARLHSGLNVIDTLLPIVRGQRIGLFAGSGVGKSRLLAALARGMEADVVVVALIGERGREVRDFVEDTLGREGMSRAVVVAATSDRSPIDRRRCLETAMRAAEYFRDLGQHVLLLADSITRYAEAHREIAISAGELPALRGYPASLSPDLMGLCERAGPGCQDSGDITAVFSVLVAGSDMDGPVADLLRGVLDGHVVLDRKIAEAGRYPAIDILRSVSRSLPDAATDGENRTILGVRALLSAMDRSETMVRAGLYRPGTDPVLDQALLAWPDLEMFLCQPSVNGAEGAFQQLDLILRRSAQSGRPPQQTRSAVGQSGA